MGKEEKPRRLQKYTEERFIPEEKNHSSPVPYYGKMILRYLDQSPRQQCFFQPLRIEPIGKAHTFHLISKNIGYDLYPPSLFLWIIIAYRLH